MLVQSVVEGFFMPYDIVKHGSEWWVITRGKEGHVHGKFKTKKAAREQQKAIYANAGNKHGK
jgi:hypothetical protein